MASDPNPIRVDVHVSTTVERPARCRPMDPYEALEIIQHEAANPERVLAAARRLAIAFCELEATVAERHVVEFRPPRAGENYWYEGYILTAHADQDDEAPVVLWPATSDVPVYGGFCTESGLDGLPYQCGRPLPCRDHPA